MKLLYHIFSLLILLFTITGCLEDHDGEAGVHNAKAPEVETLAENIKVTASSVELSGKVVRENGRKVVERGFLYGHKTPLSFANSNKWVDDGDGTGEFSGSITKLVNDTVYYVCAYAVNDNSEEGCGYGEEIQVRTPTGLPELNPRLTLLTSFTEATLMAKIESEGDSSVTSFGFRWGVMVDNVAEEGEILPVQEKNSDGTFCANLSGLMSGQRYYVVAYASNAFGTSFTPDTFFVTNGGEPIVTIQSCILNEKKGCVVLKGHIENIGISDVKKVGFCYDKNNKPTVENSEMVEASFSNDNQFEATLYLKGGYNYHFRAFAVNSQATGYSEEIVMAVPSVFKTMKVTTNYKMMPGTMASFTYGNKCYLLGGNDPDGVSNELWAYNIFDNTLDRTGAVFPLGGRKYQAVAGTAWGDVYVYGGSGDGEAKREFHAFLTSSSRWIPYVIPEDGPGALYLAAACLTNSGFVMVGGVNKQEKLTDEVWKFSAGFWSKKAPLPQAQSGGIAIMVGNLIYAGMGETLTSGSVKRLWSNSSRDIDQWIEVATMPDNNNAIRSCVALDGVIYIVDTSGVIWSYIPESGATTWTRRSKLPPEIANDVHAMFIIDDTIYFGFGSTGIIVAYNPIWDN